MKPDRTKEEILEQYFGAGLPQLRKYNIAGYVMEAMEEYRQSSPVESKWEQIEAIAYDEWKENGGLSTFEPWFVNWLQDNYHPPKRK